MLKLFDGIILSLFYPVLLYLAPSSSCWHKDHPAAKVKSCTGSHYSTCIELQVDSFTDPDMVCSSSVIFGVQKDASLERKGVWYVCSIQYMVTYSKSMDQPGTVANPARGQLNRKNEYFPCPRSCLIIWSRKTGSAVPPASVCSSPYSGWIWCVLTGFLPISAAASIY